MHFTDFIPFLTSDAYYTSGQLSARLQISPSELHDYFLQSQSAGIPIDYSSDKGYRLGSSLDLIDPHRVGELLEPEIAAKLQTYHCLNVTDSTNKLALQQPSPGEGKFSFVTAEMQTCGRGRRGRIWQSPYAGNIYLSIIWPLQNDPARASTLSPYLALALVELLHSLAMPELGVKWPNDIYCTGKKMAGLLIESIYNRYQGMKLVIGLGVNVAMTEQYAAAIDQAWTDITSELPDWSLSRSEFVAKLVNTLVSALVIFEEKQSLDLQSWWEKWDIMCNREASVSSENQDIHGIVSGIDQSGNLLLNVDGEQQKFIVGDVSLRALT